MLRRLLRACGRQAFAPIAEEAGKLRTAATATARRSIHRLAAGPIQLPPAGPAAVAGDMASQCVQLFA